MNTNIKILLTTTLLTFGLTGCVQHVKDYTPSLDIDDTITTKVSIDNGNNVIVNDLPEAYFCSLHGVISSPDSKPMNHYIENGFIEELKANNLLDENSQHKLKLYIDRVSNSSVYGFSHWTFHIRLESSNGMVIKHQSVYRFDGHSKIENSCVILKNNYPKAVKNLLNDIFTHEEFSKLFQ